MCQAFLVQVMLNSRKQVNGWMNKWENPLGTVSKWCSNSVQPDLETLDQIARLLGVNVKNLLNDTEQ